MRQFRTRPVEKLTPEKLATNFTNYSKEFRGIRVIRGQAFCEFVAVSGGATPMPTLVHGYGNQNSLPLDSQAGRACNQSVFCPFSSPKSRSSRSTIFGAASTSR